MIATRADLLYALPAAVTRARVLPGAEDWAEPLRAVNVEVVAEGDCDLVVAPPAQLDAAAATGASTAILTGAVGRGKLRAAGFAGERFLPMPSLDHPALVIPLDRPRGARYGLVKLLAPPTRVKELRNRALALAARVGVSPPGTVTLASRDGGQPLLVQKAAELGVPADAEWVLALGRASERAVFHLFAPGEATPSWVLKFSRELDGGPQEVRDAIGLGYVAEAGEAAAEHAPRLLGITSVGRRQLVVETVAVGAPLVNVLRGPISPAQKRAHVTAVAEWLIELGRATATAPDPSGREQTLASAQAPAARLGVDLAPLATAIADVPAVLEHGDAGLEHAIVDGERFVVIDWEAAQQRGLPLADLAFFLSQALPVLDGEADDPAVASEEKFARQFRGDAPSSPELFRWIDRACAAWGVAPDAVGPLLSLAWLRYAAHDARAHLAATWFSDPRLGPGWDAWRAA